MWLRAIPFFLLLYLLFDLPFFTFKQFRRSVYLYKNQTANAFIDKHPEIKNIVHLTKNLNLHPIFLISENPEDTLHGSFDYVYIPTINTMRSFINSIPTHAYINDTINIKTPEGKQIKIPIKSKNNLFYLKSGRDSFPLIIRGIPQKIYVMDTIRSFDAYHGTLRRYFESNPFISYIAIFPPKSIVYTKDRILRKIKNFKPVMSVVGKNIHIIDVNPIYNPRGFYLAFGDTTFPVPIKRISSSELKPDTVVAYLIGRKKYPLFFIKDGIGYIMTPEIDILAREYPMIFKKIMDKMVDITSKYLVYAYSDKYIYTPYETSEISILSFPSNKNCVIFRNKSIEAPIPYNRNISHYTFTPSLQDTLIIIKCGNSIDTVHITVSKLNNKHLTFNEDEFLRRIYSESYTVKRGLLGPSSESTVYYLILLFTLIFIWILERRKSLKIHN